MSLSRSLSLAGSFIGAVCNLAFALKLLALSRSLIWEGESESEWEGSFDLWAAADSVRIVWALLFAYFATAAAACFVGFVGIAKVRCRFLLVLSCSILQPPARFTIFSSWLGLFGSS